MTTGVFLVDKPRGMTSHDVVSRMRRLLGERRIGHAGTLDPMATGLLVVLVGEATKLEPYLATADKSYEATLAFGRSTNTFDADGETVEEADVPPDLLSDAARIDAALDVERARTEQVPPAHSAIHVDGRRAYELARRGEEVVLPARRVRALSVELLSIDAATRALSVRLAVTKGYYVRSFARDVGRSLGVPTHLSALRRTASGGATIAEAVALDAPREAHLSAARSLVAALVDQGLPMAKVDAPTAVAVRQGKIFACDAESPRAAILDGAGALLAIAERRDDGLFKVLRGFVAQTDAEASGQSSDPRAK